MDLKDWYIYMAKNPQWWLSETQYNHSIRDVKLTRRQKSLQVHRDEVVN